MYQEDDEKEKLVAEIVDKNFKQSTILAPIQVKLKVQRVNQIEQYDLIAIQRDPNAPDIQKQERIPSIFENSNTYNCLSKFKSYQENNSSSFNPKLAICVCAYNQDKKMLRQSLRGIYDSLQYFQKKAGIKSDEIVVVVIFDGIQKIRTGQFGQNMITFFDEVDYQNGSVLLQGQISYEDIQLHKQINKQDLKFFSTLSKSEIQLNQKRRFRTKYDYYMRMKQLQKQCKNKDRTYEPEKLSEQVRKIYDKLKQNYVQSFDKSEIKLIKKKDKNQVRKQKQKIRQKKLMQLKDYQSKKILIEKAYTQCFRLTEKFFQSRKETSLVYALQYNPLSNDKVSEDHDEQEDKYLNVLLVVKHANQGKLSSHALFLMGFCKLMQPEIIQFMDVGLKPQQGSIYKMYEYMNKNSNTGGCCGYMGLKVERAGDQFGYSEKMEHLDGNAYFMHESLFSIQKAQMFEYHFGHLIDKPFQAWFNFIHVLPGAFSCYRYSCLVKAQKQKGYIKEYLKLLKSSIKDLQTQNRYLAQDRTLSLILKQFDFDFAYLPNARAVVDPASNLIDLIGQRRRWINGSWFAFFYVFSQRGRINDILAKVQFYYYYITNGIVYLSISFFFISLFLVIQSVMQQIMFSLNISEPTASNTVNIVTHVICFIYILIVGSLTYYSILVKNSDKPFQKIFFNASTFFGLYGFLVTALMIYNLIAVGVQGWNAPIFNVTDGIIPPSVTRIFMVVTIGIFAIQVIFSFNIKIILQVLVCTPHYLFYAPTYLHILLIYAFSKIDDFSWGTKGLQSHAQQQDEEQVLKYFRIKKYLHIYKFIGWNCIVSLIGIILINYNNSKSVFIAIFSGIFLLITAIKFIFSILYLLKYYIKDLSQHYSEEQIRQNIRHGSRISKTISQRVQDVRLKTKNYIYQKLNEIFNKDISKIKKKEFKNAGSKIKPNYLNSSKLNNTKH